jgi:hypothetical protein
VKPNQALFLKVISRTPPPRLGIDLTAFVVIGTDCISRWKSTCISSATIIKDTAVLISEHFMTFNLQYIIRLDDKQVTKGVHSIA